MSTEPHWVSAWSGFNWGALLTCLPGGGRWCTEGNLCTLSARPREHFAKSYDRILLQSKMKQRPRAIQFDAVVQVTLLRKFWKVCTFIHFRLWLHLNKVHAECCVLQKSECDQIDHRYNRPWSCYRAALPQYHLSLKNLSPPGLFLFISCFERQNQYAVMAFASLSSHQGRDKDKISLFCGIHDKMVGHNMKASLSRRMEMIMYVCQFQTLLCHQANCCGFLMFSSSMTFLIFFSCF